MPGARGKDGVGVEGEGERETGMAALAFKGFPAHRSEGKGVSTSDAGDRRCSALHLRTRASASDGDAVSKQPTRVHLEYPS